MPSPGGVLTYSEWCGTGRAGNEDTRTASREPLKRRLSAADARRRLPALDKLDKHHLRPVASEQQRAGQAPSANSSDGARPAGDLHYEERRPAWRRRREEEERGGGDISTRSKRCASHTPIYSLSPPPFLPLPTHRPLQLLQPALRSATQRKGEGRSAATATSTSRSRGHAPSPSPSLVKRFLSPRHKSTRTSHTTDSARPASPGYTTGASAPSSVTKSARQR